MNSRNFMGKRVPLIILSLLLIVGGGVMTYLQGGFNLGVDFASGVQLVVEGNSSVEELRTAFPEATVQQMGDTADNRYSLKMAGNNFDESEGSVQSQVNSILNDSFGSSLTVLTLQEVSGSYSSSFSSQTLIAGLVAILLIFIYIRIRFLKAEYAVSALLAVVHDILFLLAFIGAMQLDFTASTVAALLTIIGYSLNDTIVIFDRIREEVRLNTSLTPKELINLSLTKTFSRTVITSLTTLFAVGAIYAFSIGDIQSFALVLIVGVIVGTFSSLFIASSSLLGFKNRHAKKAATTYSIENTTSSKTQAVEKESPPKPKKRAPKPVQQTHEEIERATEAKKKKKKKKK